MTKIFLVFIQQVNWARKVQDKAGINEFLFSSAHIFSVFTILHFRWGSAPTLCGKRQRAWLVKMRRRISSRLRLKFSWPFFLAGFPEQIPKKSLQPKFEVEIYLALFSWLVSQQNTWVFPRYPCHVDLLQTFSLLTQMQI